MFLLMGEKEQAQANLKARQRGSIQLQTQYLDRKVVIPIGKAIGVIVIASRVIAIVPIRVSTSAASSRTTTVSSSVGHDTLT